ncbi:MAG: glycosyltransferase [Rhodothermales bacterium]
MLMRLTLLTAGSRGDVQPYIALGKSLADAGYTVTVAAHAPFEAFVEGHGLSFFPLSGDPKAMLEGETGRAWLETNGNPIQFLRGAIELARPELRALLADCVRATEDADAILYPTLLAFAGASIGEARGIPAIPAYLQHVHPTKHYPPPFTVPAPVLAGLVNHFAYQAGYALFWRLIRDEANAWRRSALGLAPLPNDRPITHWMQHAPMCLYGFSRHVLPPPNDWPTNAHVTGYWFLDAPDWSPPKALADFLNDGPPPVYIGFGSMTNRDPEAVATMVVEALQRTGERGLLLTGWGGIADMNLPNSVFVIDGAPHHRLFPRMKAVVHHGGAGTTAAGLRAGRPSILIPFFGDQPFWGWRVASLGVGPKPVPRKHLTADQLAHAIQQATTDERMQARAERLGAQVQAEHEAQRWLPLIERALSPGAASGR